MATKPRRLKTETQLWVYDNAKRLNLTDADLAKATGVETGTARSWFSRGKPNADAIAVLEQLFGRPAPQTDETAAPEGTAAIIAALERAIATQTQAIVAAIQARDSTLEKLLDELGNYRSSQLDVLRALKDSAPRAEPMPADEHAHEPLGSVPTRSVQK